MKAARKQHTPAPATDTLTGSVHRVVFESDEGYRVLALTIADGANATAVGTVPPVQVGEELKLTGRWVTHPKHGRRFEIAGIEKALPITREGVIRYLSSGFARGLGPKNAEKIVDHLGPTALEKIAANPDVLKNVPGLSEAVRASFASSWAEQHSQANAMALLHSAGIGPGTISRILKEYGSAAAQTVAEDTYRLAREITGIGFLKADSMARQLGTPLDDQKRIDAGLLHCLEEAMGEGHTALRRDSLIELAGSILTVPDPLLIEGMRRLENWGDLLCDISSGEALVYKRAAFRRETYVAQRLWEIAKAPAPAHGNVVDLVSCIQARLVPERIEGQIRAATTAIQSKVSCITGLPGTGKTTVIRIIIEALQNLEPGKTIALVAPTGKAAKRMTEATGHEASTIHRRLKYDPRTADFVHNEHNPLDVDTLILDESSMLTLSLTALLLRALRTGVRIIFIGDTNQLAPVGYGQPFADIIASGCIPVSELTQISRQAKNSAIIRACQILRDGYAPAFDGIKPDSDYWGIRAENADEAKTELTKLCTDILPRHGYNVRRDVQILAPMRRGKAGLEVLNAIAAPIFNPNRDGLRYRVRGGFATAGDRVQQLSNNYDFDVFNGEQGDLAAVAPDPQDARKTQALVGFDQREVTYDPTMSDELMIAYAISVHRSQGSEFPVVITLLLPEAWIMMQRNLVLTAISRARKLHITIGSPKCLSYAARNVSSTMRIGALRQRLTAMAA
jgi:exodeoxyribonuclease V alpha subunit